MKKLLILLSLLTFSCNNNVNISSLHSSSYSSIDESSSSLSKESSNEISSSINKIYTIYINPSVQVNNIYYNKVNTEAEIMNKIGIKIYQSLIKYAFLKVYINDRYLSLKESVNEINALNVDYHLALHSNAGGGSGSECYYYTNSSFANSILNDFDTIHQFPQRGIKKGLNLYELKNSKAKNKALIEFLFHDNYQESQFLINNVNLIAKTITASFVDLLM